MLSLLSSSYTDVALAAFKVKAHTCQSLDEYYFDACLERLQAFHESSQQPQCSYQQYSANEILRTVCSLFPDKKYFYYRAKDCQRSVPDKSNADTVRSDSRYAPALVLAKPLPRYKRLELRHFPSVSHVQQTTKFGFSSVLVLFPDQASHAKRHAISSDSGQAADATKSV